MAWYNTALSGFWGGIKPYATDPMAWLGAAGTGLGVYDAYRRQQAEKNYLRKQQDWQRQVQATANAPLNVEAIFNPAKAGIQRDLEAGLAERGMQPGGAWGAAMGEGMMRQYLNAAQIAEAQRRGQLQALTGATAERPQYPGQGDVSALGKYLQYKRESSAAEKARSGQQSFQEKLLELMKGQQQPQPWWMGTGREQNMQFPGADVYAGSYDDMTNSPYPGWVE